MGFHPADIPGLLPNLLRGLGFTVLAAFVIMALALVVALPVALARMSHRRWLRYPATIYVQVLRGTPVLLQLFYLYYVLPFAGIRLNPWTAGIVGMSAAYSAYLSEIYRAGIEAIDRGQTEAALSLGMSRVQVMRIVVFPQAFRIVIPPIGNMFIGLFKDTSLLSILTIRELMFEGQLLAATTFRHITIFTVIALLYLAVCWPSAAIIDRLEKRLKATPHDKGSPARSACWRLSVADAGDDGVIRLANIHKWFGSLDVLRGIDLEVERGEVVVVDRPERIGQEHAAAGDQLPRAVPGGNDLSRRNSGLRTSRTAGGVTATPRRRSARFAPASAWCRSASTSSRT